MNSIGSYANTYVLRFFMLIRESNRRGCMLASNSKSNYKITEVVEWPIQKDRQS
jgi:hypothetical protein